MSHNLEITDRGASFVYNQNHGSVWHRLGTPVSGEFAADCVKEAIGTWQVETTPVYQKIRCDGLDGEPFTKYRKDEGQVHIIRSDNQAILGRATHNYVPIQNEYGFSFFDSLVRDGKAKYTSAGVLGNGYRVFLVAATKNQIHIGGEDTVEPFVVLDLPHTGKDSAQYFLSSVRPVCQNTLNASISGASNIGKIRHRGNVEAKLELAGRLLGQAGKYFDELGGAFRWLAGVEVKSEKVLTEYLIETFTGRKLDWLRMMDDEEIGVRTQNKINTSKRLFDGRGRGSNFKTARGTWWGAYNAVTELIDHRVAANRKKELEYAGYGAGREVKERALTCALQYATKSE